MWALKPLIILYYERFIMKSKNTNTQVISCVQEEEISYKRPQHSKTWIAAMKYQGSFEINDPKFRL